MSKIIECKFECGTKLGEFDQDAHKYKEVDTGELHTQERCIEAKAKRATQTELSKQNEQKLKQTVPVSDYVDHTAKGLQLFRAFSAPTTEILTEQGNSWIRDNQNKIQVKLIGQLQTNNKNGEYAITVYYEEKP